MVPVLELGSLTASDCRKLFRVMEMSRWLWWYLVSGKSCHSAQLNNWIFCLYTKFIKAGEGTKSPYRADITICSILLMRKLIIEAPGS